MYLYLVPLSHHSTPINSPDFYRNMQAASRTRPIGGLDWLSGWLEPLTRSLHSGYGLPRVHTSLSVSRAARAILRPPHQS